MSTENITRRAWAFAKGRGFRLLQLAVAFLLGGRFAPGGCETPREVPPHRLAIDPAMVETHPTVVEGLLRAAAAWEAHGYSVPIGIGGDGTRVEMTDDLVSARGAWADGLADDAKRWIRFNDKRAGVPTQWNLDTRGLDRDEHGNRISIDDCGQGAADAEWLAVHEIGHWLGFSHPKKSKSWQPGSDYDLAQHYFVTARTCWETDAEPIWPDCGRDNDAFCPGMWAGDEIELDEAE